MKVTDIKRDLVELEAIFDNKKNATYAMFRREVLKILRSHSIKRVNGGSYSDVYSAKDFKYVIKIIKQPDRSTYKKNYSNIYLKPIYVSKNKCLVIQQKVPILEDLLKKIYDKYGDAHGANLGLVDGKILLIDLDSVFEYK